MMQKLVLSIIAMTLAIFSVTAMPGERHVINAGNTEHIIISGDLNIILIAGPGTDQSMLVGSSVTDKLSLKFSQNTLAIAPANFGSSRNITVYVYVNVLRSLVIENDATVRTVGVINSPKLELMIGGEGKVHLKTNGVVNPTAIFDAEIKVDFISQNGMDKERLTKSNRNLK